MPAEPPAGAEPDKDDGPVRALDADDIALLKSYGLGPYTASIKVSGEGEGRGSHSIGKRRSARLAPLRCRFLPHTPPPSSEGEGGRGRA